MWREVIEVFSAVLVSMGGLELVKWLTTRKASAKRAAAEADREVIGTADKAIEVMERTNGILSKQVEELTKQVYENTQRIIDLTKRCGELELMEQKYHCEVRGCASRMPPNGY